MNTDLHNATLSKDLLWALMQQSSDGIEIVDPESGRFLEINEMFCATHGYSRDELLSMRVGDINPSLAPQGLWEKKVTELFLVGTWVSEGVHRRKDGSMFPVEVNIKHIFLDRDYLLAIVRDITVRKQAERTALYNEQRFRNLVETSSDWIWEVDQHAVYTYASPRVRDLLGYEPEEMLGKTPFSFMPEAEAKRVSGIFQAAAAARKPIHLLENINHHKSGHVVILETSGVPFFDEHGEFRGYRGVDRDITGRNQMLTDRQRAAEQLHKLSRAVEQCPVCIVITNRLGIIEYVNPRFCELTGYSYAEAVGQNPRVLKSGDQSPEFYRDLWQTINSGRTWSGEFHNRKKSGELFWEWASISPIVDQEGHITHFVAVKEDITARKRSEEQLKRSADVLRLVPDAILMRDLEDNIIYWNYAAETIYGWPTIEALGKSLPQLLGYNAAAYAAAKQSVLTGGEWRGDLTVRNKAGLDVLIEARWLLIHDAKGKPSSILSIATDVTEKQRMEAQLLRAQRMESLGVLAGGVAHDLNNVLTPLLIAIQMLRDDLPTQEKEKMLDLLQGNVIRGASLIKQLLAFGRGIKGERIPVKLTPLAREIEQIVRETFPKSITFRLHASRGLKPVPGDATQLHQVLMNLCVNARDAMPEGGVLSLRLENTSLNETFVRGQPGVSAGEFVRLTVTDSGIGMSPEVQEKIFDPFFTTKPPGKGTGLGLSTTLGIVQSHGGFILCESEVGGGTIFSVFLPCIGDVQEQPGGCKGQQAPRGRNELILLVDDEDPILLIGKKILESFGYRVLVARNGADALDIYRGRMQEVAAIITDIAMPLMDGISLVKELQILNRQAKIIVCSGYAADGGVSASNTAGVRCFISKPYSPNELLHALDGILNPSLTQ